MKNSCYKFDVHSTLPSTCMDSLKQFYILTSLAKICAQTDQITALFAGVLDCMYALVS